MSVESKGSAARAPTIVHSTNAMETTRSRLIDRLSPSGCHRAGRSGPAMAALKGPPYRISDALQLCEAASAVALRFLVNVVEIEDAQQQVARRDGLALVGELAIASQLPVRAADEDVRHIEMLMLIRVPHVRAVHD